MKTFRKRIGKHTKISNLEERDRKRIHRIIRLMWQEGGLIAPRLLRSRVGMTPRRHYEYLSWLRKNGYITQEKRRKPLQLTLKGQNYWATRDIREMIKEAEAPEQIIQQVVSEYVKKDRERAYKETMPAILKVFDNAILSLVNALRREITEITETSQKVWRDFFPRIDKEYRSRVKQLGYEVVGDWEGLRKKG